MIERKTTGDKIFDAFNYILLTVLAFCCIYPLWHVLCGSFSNPVELSKHSGALLWPLGFSLDGYKNVWSNPNIGQGFLNTLFYVGFGTVVRMILTVIGAYVLSEKHFMLRKPMTLMIVFTMYFTGGMIPDYLLVNALNLTNTRWALIVPLAITTWNMIILKTAFQSVPSALLESARLDGAGEMRTLVQIILPVTKASLAVISMYYIVNEWNSWLKAAIYLPARKEYHPLQLVLRDLLIVDSGSSSTSLAEGSGLSVETLLLQEVLRYAAIVVSTLPIIAIYPFAQKYFVKGVMMGSVKG